MEKHAPIPTIVQDFVEIQELYKPKENSNSNFSSVQLWLNHIKHIGYSDKITQEIYLLIAQRAEQEHSEEAALLLLVSVSTQNTFFNYILAKELFKGKILEKNIPASYGLLSILSDKGNHEATCDLALFYKHGIIVEKDRTMALKLYKQASDAGIERATTHYESLKNNPPGFFDRLFNRI